MRMWKVPVSLMCNKHLCGEHYEMHMFLGCIKKNKSLKGYVEKGLVEVHNLKNRHIDLSNEMMKRGFKHNSDVGYIDLYKAGKVDISNSIKELCNRCIKCRELGEKGG